MDQSKITVRYAKAFFSLAKEKNQLDILKKDIELVSSLCSTSPDFIQLLESPVIKTSQKQKLVDAIFKGKIDELSLNFLHLVVTNKREAHLPGMCRNLLKLSRDEQGIKTAHLKTAVELNPELTQEIQTQLASELNATIELIKEVDPKLIGGFIVRVEDQQVDASIARQLRKVKEELLQSDLNSKQR